MPLHVASSRLVRPCAIAALVVLGRALSAQPRPIPTWAYPLADPAAPVAPPPDSVTARHVPGSAATFTFAQTQNHFAIADWHPDGHPSMPVPVSTGRRPDAWGCAYCHLPNGQGRPENASIAGLPAAYIARQVSDFRTGHRRSSEPRFVPTISMTKIANAATDDEVRLAAAYFASMRPKPWIRVVEADSVPATHVVGPMLVPVTGGSMEPIAGRVIEVPEDLARTELRDDASSFVAYVPMGAVARGRALVTKGGDRTQPCSRCHGSKLTGAKEIPRLAGRSPSYLTRQLHDFQNGTRAGALADPMKQVVAKLSDDDIVSIVAYLASRAP